MVAPWPHTFTAGAPLSFLDHHLRPGDSLYGEWVDEAGEEFRRVASFFFEGIRARIAQAGKAMNEVAEISDTDIAEVRQSQELFGDAEDALEPLRRVLDLWHALRWLSPKGRREGLERPGAGPLIRGSFGALESVLTQGEVAAGKPEEEADAEAVNDLLAGVREIVQRERFLHRELAFPTVWRELDRRGGRGTWSSRQ